MDKKMWVFIVLTLIIGLGAGWWYGDTAGYKRGDEAGYKRAEADVKTLQEEFAKKAGEAAAKAANPFQAVNPLGTVEANPFEKAKKVLNPFQ